ncbi:hypothetical protein AQUCO_03500012v1 [Aquilegia coerulea]|uniref:Uncharacterized protein n=1 Tax=Aquilegia coerulea TaxID=218851 RepID=A0A2G5CVL2_AQUCA|nr:hypothetical protein AQUCO_03500012v1 [Aquilegia coerulea]
MGICFSKKTSSSSPPQSQSHHPIPKSENINYPTTTTTSSPPLETETPLISIHNKKEIFFIKQRNSHERRPEDIKSNNTNTITAATTKSSSSSSSPSPTLSSSPCGIVAAGSAPASAPVRTSSCTKEEVDAILIQCGRLSRSSSGKATNSSTEPVGGEKSARKYSGSKRSYDFDHENTRKCTDELDGDKYSSLPSHRRTPSRETDVEYKRSGSNRHRSSSSSSSTSREEDRKRNHNQSGGRRLSRSPARRSDQTTTTTTTILSSSAPPDKLKGPAKMISVPASTTGGAIKRVSVNRTTASPRSQSPANAHPSLSRNSSRKADHSPYRRNPLTEIDDNVLRSEQINNPVGTNKTDEGLTTKKNFHFQSQKSDERNGGIGKQKSAGKDQKNQNENELAFKAAVALSPKARDAGIENLKLPQTTITRSRSSRRSRDLDFINDDVLANVPTSYASILLEDIQNFHHNNSNTTAFSLPPCVAKACSILDAVADLNSSTNSNISSAFSEERNSRPSNNNSNSHNNNVCSSNVHLGKTRLEVVNKDPFVEETELLVNDDLMEPSIHKYITVRRGVVEEMEQQESSGSNSIVGQQWFASSLWEPNSADSTDHWNAGGNEEVVDKEEPSLLVHKKAGFSEGWRKLSGKKRELDHRHQLGKVGAKTHTAPIAAAASM